MLFPNPQRGFSRDCFSKSVFQVSEDASREDSHLLLILNQQNAFGTARGFGFR